MRTRRTFHARTAGTPTTTGQTAPAAVPGCLLRGLVEGGALLGAGARGVCASRLPLEDLEVRLARLGDLSERIASYALERVDWRGSGQAPAPEAVTRLLRQAVAASGSQVARILLADALLRWEALCRCERRSAERDFPARTIPRLLALIGRAGHEERARERRANGRSAPVERLSHLQALATGAQTAGVLARLTRRFLGEAVRAARSASAAEAGGGTSTPDVTGVLERGELVLDCQPVVDLVTGALVGVEGLVRWQRPTRGFLSPSAFLEPARDAHELTLIENWVLLTAAFQVQSWQRRYRRPDLTVAVNLSRTQLEVPEFPEILRRVLDSSGLAPGTLVVEIGDPDLLDRQGSAAQTLRQLRRMGVRVALEDFGAGPAPWGSGRERLPLDIAKVDRSLVLGSGTLDHTLLEGVVALARRLGLEVVPGGIEREEDLAVVQALGCLKGQGFLLGGPVSAREIDRRLASGTTVPEVELARDLATRLTGGPTTATRKGNRPVQRRSV